RDPVSGRMASGAYELDSAAVALLAPVRGLADQAARGASGPGRRQTPPPGAGWGAPAPPDVFGRPGGPSRVEGLGL
ncbi:MAG: hypothetical protein LBD77_03590, partial [Bifidobacteriaceae bacterium]|nr:hypothetical protein [Bifidobacteriaceae bacterium]